MSATSGDHVVIIGAGIIGIASAHYIKKLGCAVTVIDAGTVAGACSHGNCGHILPSHILPLNDPSALQAAALSLFDRDAAFKVKPRMSAGFIKWMWNFALHCNNKHKMQAATALHGLLQSSYDEYIAMIQEHAFNCDWDKNGSLYLFKDDANLQKFSKTNAWCDEHFDVSAEHIPSEKLTDFDPALSENLAGGYFYSDDACVRPDKLASQWVSQLKKDGVKFIEHCSFETLEEKSGRITKVITSKGVIAADHVVLAAGAMSEALAKQFACSIPLEPGKGYAVSLKRPADCPQASIILPEESIALTTFPDQLRLGSIMELVGYDTSIPERRMQQLISRVQPYLKSELSAPIIDRWYGWRPMTWDSLPIIGRSTAHTNAFIATGHNMIGLMSAPSTGMLIAELLSEQAPHINAAAFSPARFS